ncbi:MAG: multicopper oxidase family protein, partial [Nitrososphaeraceae archaeon]
LFFFIALIFTIFISINIGNSFSFKDQNYFYDLNLTDNIKNESFVQFNAQTIIKNINGVNNTMFSINGQIPGPIIKTSKDNLLFINFTNNLNEDSIIHWHGIKLDNLYDGVPNLTQKPIKPGESFVYKINFPDEGVYWYHSHVREDKQQELGLYGLIIVEPLSPTYYNDVDLEIPLILDDILLNNNSSIYPFEDDLETFSLMGRYGNTMFINGQLDYSLDINKNSIVRFFIVNTANAKPFNFTIENHDLKLVGGDAGKFEKESFVNSVILSPSERAIVEIFFNNTGTFNILNQIPNKNEIIGTIKVFDNNKTEPKITNIETEKKNKINTFFDVKTNDEMTESINQLKKYFDKDPDYYVELDMETNDIINMHNMNMHNMNMNMQDESHNSKENMDIHDKTIHSSNTTHSKSIEKIEWQVPDEMYEINKNSNNENIKWILRDKETGKENENLILNMSVGDIKKIRFYNNPNSPHPMQHPIHIHGIHFLVLNVDGKQNDNLVWKDTVLIPTGSTVDILMFADNPGKWQFHCHISEHLGAGMASIIDIKN